MKSSYIVSFIVYIFFLATYVYIYCMVRIDEVDMLIFMRLVKFSCNLYSCIPIILINIHEIYHNFIVNLSTMF